jgi:hypothetical protein
VKRAAIIAGLVASLLVLLVLGLRMPGTRGVLIDLPGVGPVLEWVSDLVRGPTPRHPIEVAYRLGRTVSPDELARARDRLDRLAMLPVSIRGDRLVVTADPTDDPLRATFIPRRDPIRVFVVVYQSPELDRIRKALGSDEQAKHLGLSVDLDYVGYHVHAPADMMYVNPAWADAHHCTGHRIEGTGIACPLTPRERLDAYVRGDAGLFTDPHPDALATPPGRSFYIEDDGDAYELEATPIEIAPSQIADVQVAGDVVQLMLAPSAAAAIAARATSPDIELVAEIAPGQLQPVTLSGPAVIAFAVRTDPQRVADELALAALGLHPIH